MSILSIVLSCLCTLLGVLLSVSVYFNVKHGMIILRMQDSIEECLDELDKKYQSMSQILDIPIFFDSVEIRQVISDIEKSRDSVLKVANRLTASGSNQGEIEDAAEDS